MELPFTTVEAVESIEALDPDQSRMLAQALEEHPDLQRADLAVYRMTDGRAVVAPRSDAVNPGSRVLATGWAEAVQRTTSEGNSAELHIASRLLLDSDFAAE